MTLRALRAADRVPVPWRNGGGATREVATDGSEPFLWRVSIADVASNGPFSLFSGYTRTITLVRGAGMRLTIDGIAHTIDQPYRMFQFSGDARTECELVNGAVVDLNVMHAGAPARQRIIVVNAPVEIAVADTAIAIVLENTVVARQPNAPDLEFGEFDAVRAREPFTIVPGRGSAAVVAIVNFD
jgi:environmental stress-induced protein Ves